MDTRYIKGKSSRQGKQPHCMLVWLLLCIPFLAVRAWSVETTVVYPQVREPFAALYRDYLAGINQVLPDSPRVHAVNGGEADALARDIASNPPEVIIALGNKSLRIAQRLEGDHPLVALVANRDHEKTLAGGIVLKPSAEIYLENLLAIHGAVKQIFVVYNPEIDQNLVSDVERLATQRGITLSAFKARSIREAAAEYQKLLRSARAYSAIWLLPDNGFLDSSMLSTILDVAWERRLVVFSSNPLFVKHGALFAVYPDNRAVGMSVARIAMEAAKGKKQPLEPLRDVRMTINERTLNHLGLPLSPDVRGRIDLMLPGR